MVQAEDTIGENWRGEKLEECEECENCDEYEAHREHKENGVMQIIRNAKIARKGKMERNTIPSKRYPK